MSIRAKIVVSILLSVILAVTGSIFIVYWQSRTDVAKNFGDNATVQIRLVGDYLSRFIQDMSVGAQVIADQPTVRSARGKVSNYLTTTERSSPKVANLPPDEQEIAKNLKSVEGAFSACELVYIGMEDGSFLQVPDDDLGAGFDPRTRTWFTDAKAANGRTIATPPYKSDNGNLVCTVARSFSDTEGKFLGVVGVDVNFKEVTTYLDTLTIGKTGHMILTDPQGLILYDPDDSSRLFKTIDQVGNPGLSQIFSMGKGFGEISFDNVPHLAVTGTTPEGWRVILLIEQEELLSDAANIVKDMLTGGLLLVVVLLCVSLLVARSIGKPISRMVTAVEGVADGNFDALPRGDVFTGELRQLHKSMVRMVDQLVTLLETARHKTNEAEVALEQGRKALQMAEEAQNRGERARQEGVKETAGRLEGVVQNLSTASRVLHEHASTIVSSVETQLMRTSETATAMSQMNDTVEAVASSAAQASQLAEHTKKEAQTGRHTVDDVVNSISEVEQFTNEMSDSMSRLVKQAEGIGLVINIITDVADQTNLLALNAAIEAARAGEAGKGFAVVADEVRKLAEKTMDATKSVTKAISEIQQGAESNNQLIGQSVEQVRHSTQLARLAGEALERIEGMVIGSADQVYSIAAASKQQMASSSQVTHHTQDVHDSAGEVSEAMQIASQNIASVNQMIGELQAIINSLK